MLHAVTQGRIFAPPPRRSLRYLPTLNESDRDSLLLSLREFRSNFAHGFVFAASCELVSFLLDQPPSSFDLTHSILSYARVARDMAAYPLVQSVALTVCKPTLRTFGQWLPFAVATSLSTAAVLRTFNIISANWEIDGKISLNGWRKGAAIELAQRVGFQVGLGAADHVIPPAGKIGGPVARDLSIVLLATVGDFAAAAPLRMAGGVGLLQIIDDCSRALSTAFLETMLYRAVKHFPGLDG
jgi:hypothetical protein